MTHHDKRALTARALPNELHELRPVLHRLAIHAEDPVTWQQLRQRRLRAGSLANYLFALLTLFALYSAGTHVVVPR